MNKQLLAIFLSIFIILSQSLYAAPLYRAAVEANGFLYVSGQNAQTKNENLKGNIKEQTTEAIKLLQVTLKKHGYTLSDVIDVNVALAKQSNFAGFNEVYQKYFPNRPARSTALGVLHQDQGVWWIKPTNATLTQFSSCH